MQITLGAGLDLSLNFYAISAVTGPREINPRRREKKRWGEFINKLFSLTRFREWRFGLIIIKYCYYYSVLSGRDELFKRLIILKEMRC